MHAAAPESARSLDSKNLGCLELLIELLRLCFCLGLTTKAKRGANHKGELSGSVAKGFEEAGKGTQHRILQSEILVTFSTSFPFPQKPSREVSSAPSTPFSGTVFGYLAALSESLLKVQAQGAIQVSLCRLEPMQHPWSLFWCPRAPGAPWSFVKGLATYVQDLVSPRNEPLVLPRG